MQTYDLANLLQRTTMSAKKRGAYCTLAVPVRYDFRHSILAKRNPEQQPDQKSGSLPRNSVMGAWNQATLEPESGIRVMSSCQIEPVGCQTIFAPARVSNAWLKSAAEG